MEHAALLEQPLQDRQDARRRDPRRVADADDAVGQRPPGMRPDRPAVQGGGPAAAGGEQLAAGRVEDQADLDPAVADIGDRHAPIGQAADEGLGPVDRIDHPDAARGIDRRAAGFLAEEAVGREGGGQLVADQLFGGEVGLAQHVARALLLHHQRIELREIAGGQRAGLADQALRESQARRQRIVGHDRSRHSQAAPRTPLASPCTALRIGVAKTVEKICPPSAAGRSA